MNNNNNVKILIIGPQQSGKTAISNYISGRFEGISQNYRPTKAVRILEFEKETPKNPKRPGAGKSIIEIWDVSGDTKFDRCWPAIQKGASGIILCYNAENPKHENELENWVNWFPKKMGIPASLCIGFAHHISGKQPKQKTKAAKGLANLQIYDTTIESGQESIHPAFDKFFNNLMLAIYEKEEKEEQSIMK